MAIYARRNWIITNFGPNIVLTQPLKAGQVLVYDECKGSFINEDGSTALSGAVPIVPDIPARDALIPTLDPGSMVFVEDSGNGNHEYAVYMWNGTSFITISTQNSAEADANTISFTLYYNSPAVNLLGSILPGHRAVNITVDVVIPFDGPGATLSIGDAQNGVTGLMDTSENDLTSIQDFMTEGKYVYTGTQEVNFSAYYTAMGSTQGQAEIIVSYV